MLLSDYICYLAGLLVTISLVPQIISVYKLKSAREISMLFNTSMLLGIVLWLVYGIMLGLVPVIIWNAIGIVLSSLLLLAKLNYGRSKAA